MFGLCRDNTNVQVLIYNLQNGIELVLLQKRNKKLKGVGRKLKVVFVGAKGAGNLIVLQVWDGKFLSSPAGSDSLIGSFLTKQTPISKVHFSHRNILFVGGSFTI